MGREKSNFGRCTVLLLGLVVQLMQETEGWVSMASSLKMMSHKVADWDEAEGVWKNKKAAQSNVVLPPGDVFVFGYGSLIKNPGPLKKFEKQDAYLDGWRLYFAQKSTDHRGTPSDPGLVVTVVPDEYCQKLADSATVMDHTPRVWGVIFRVPEPEVPDILDYLDVREKGGYSQEVADVMPVSDGAQAIKALMYKGDVDNPNFEASAIRDIETAARRIANAVGPSGRNIEYFTAIVQYLTAIGRLHESQYLSELNTLVLQYEAQKVREQWPQDPIIA